MSAGPGFLSAASCVWSASSQRLSAVSAWSLRGERITRVSPDLAAAVLLIAVPIAFNLAFFELGRAFDYPNILRKKPDEILRRFAAGGSPLILRWEALLVSALAMLPLVALLAVALHAALPLTVTSVVVGSAAALVQALGLVRWPFVVPE